MSFLKSAINQVGRDAGKVISNELFKDKHASPVRIVDAGISKATQRKTVSRGDFEKAISFVTSFRPNTLINKLMGAYTILKNEIHSFCEDDHIDAYEASRGIRMIQEFSMKMVDIDEVLSIDVDKNHKEIQQLTNIHLKLKSLIQKISITAIEGCEYEAGLLQDMADAKKSEIMGFWKFVGLHTAWMGKHARGASKDMFSTIIGNAADILPIIWGYPFFIITRPFLFIKGMSSYSTHKAKINNQANKYLDEANRELQRREIFKRLLGTVDK